MLERHQLSGMVALREGTQTPPYIPTDARWDDPNLQPPAMIDRLHVANLIAHLGDYPNYSLELPTPFSSPTTAKQTAELLVVARQHQVIDRVALHTRMKQEEVDLAVAVGATNVHLFGNSIKPIGGRIRSAQEWVQQFSQCWSSGTDAGIRHMRASLELSTEVDIDQLRLFAIGILGIARPSGTTIALGLPDTNGRGTPEQYQAVITALGPELADQDIPLYVHNHDDTNRARANTQAIRERAGQHGIPLVVEGALRLYPGERVGTGPDINEVATLVGPAPDTAFLLYGSTWKIGPEPESSRRAQALRTDVAGVHTCHSAMYGTGNGERRLPAPGIYTIEGKGNIIFTAQTVFQRVPNEQTAIYAAGIGRELAAQDGNLHHGDAIALAQLSLDHPDILARTYTTFGPPQDWLLRPSPNLNEIRDQIGMIKQQRWGN